MPIITDGISAGVGNPQRSDYTQALHVMQARGRVAERAEGSGRAGTTIDAGGVSAVLDWRTRHPLPRDTKRSTEEIDAAIEAESASRD